MSYMNLLGDAVHDVPWPGEFDLQLAPVLHKEVHQRAGHRGGGMEKEGGDPEDGLLQLLQV